MSLPLRHPLENVSSLDRVFEDLLVRFVINCPPEDLSSVERELFHFEEASWFYTDFVKLMNPTLPSFKIKSFAKNIIRLCPLVWNWDIHADEALQKFSQYKKSIPVRGAAIFNEKLNKILLVKGTESDSWSFPRGKISKDEDDVACCVREVREEIGFDLTDYIDENQFIERNIQGKNYKIFIISGVSENYNFKPQVRNEIEKIEWRDFRKIQKTMHKSSVRYYLINSMMRPLSMWVRRQKHIIGDDQLRQYAEDQLKLLLGITKEEQVDPGRELLNMLHSAVQQQEEKPENPQETAKGEPTIPTAAAPMVNQMMFPQIMPPAVMGFRPFAPFPFMNGNVPPFMGPHRAPGIPPIDTQQHPQQHQHGTLPTPLGPGNPPQAIPTPDVSSLSRPAFAQEQLNENHQRSDTSSKQLLELLNSKNRSEQQRERPDPNESTQEEDSTPPGSASSDLLNILKKSQLKSEPLVTPYSQNNGHEKLPSQDEYEEFESSSEGSINEDNQQEDDEPNSKSDSDGYEDFESDVSEEHFKEPTPPPKPVAQEAVKQDINKEPKEPKEFKGANHHIGFREESPAPTEGAKPKPKIKLLKRGENLADVLPKQSPPLSTSEKSPSSEDLLGLLKKPHNSSKPQESSEESLKQTGEPVRQVSVPPVNQSPLHFSQQPDVQHHQQQPENILPQFPQPIDIAVPKLQQSPEEELLGMLRKGQSPQPQQDDLNNQESDSHRLLEVLKNRTKRNSIGSPLSEPSASPHNFTNVNPVLPSDSHAASSELLGILRRPINGNSSSPSQVPYGSMGDLFKTDSSYGASPSNELLGILHRK
ncbi:hypothetical protein ZYGR_0H05340 [Zygosaccharomyces rouxii]|uniref:Nudix hydrolase domain-containing protein n=1 Tax=Zygosaccharomyces rouxii TaxID=4956 RepID=A0A1Q2ZWI9_ZYGRO|nr:hypothetical protein ZYGR_0H05340 [Zygosaccharomyces rouxii]